MNIGHQESGFQQLITFAYIIRLMSRYGIIDSVGRKERFQFLMCYCRLDYLHINNEDINLTFFVIYVLLIKKGKMYKE